MPKFDELNKKRGIAQYYSEASKATDAAMNTKGIDRTFSEKGNQLSYEKTAAGMCAAGGFGESTYMTDWHQKSFRIIDEAESKAMERTALKALLHNSQIKENNMGLQLDSRDYKDFLRLVKDKDNDWTDKEFYELFYRNNKIRRKRLLEAILDRKIKCKITIENEEALSDELQEFDENIIAVIDGCIDNYYDREGLPTTLLLEGASFFAWLNKEYPYEGTEKKLKGSDSITDSPQSQKRENNLLKIIGGFVQTVYLQKDTGAYRNGDKPNISAIADAFQDELSKAGYSDKGFQNSSLRKIITDALERIEENKNS